MAYKLTYFDMTGRAEPIRILFAVAGVDYEDVRISFSEFGERKSKLPWGQVPILEVDGTTLSQSGAIGRFLAKKFGFHGKNDLESARIDEFVDACADYGEGFGAIRRATNDEAKAAAQKNFVEVATPKYFTKFSEIVEKNGGKHVVGDSLTWADLILFNAIEFFEATTKVELTKGYPVLKTFVQGIGSIPKIHDWIERRPKTKM